ncbi:MAG: DUF433 domain-containing protein [Cytophagales bacterium]|nr:DUF433 domain-containing protein [Cytophagales bacterium]
MNHLKIDPMQAITQNPNIMSGAPCFSGTRVPVATLFDNLRDGATLNQFVEWFPGVSLQQVKDVLKQTSDEVFKLVR